MPPILSLIFQASRAVFKDAMHIVKGSLMALIADLLLLIALHSPLFVQLFKKMNLSLARSVPATVGRALQLIQR